MEKNIMTKEELMNYVKNFIETVEPTIDALNADIRENGDNGNIGYGMVITIATPDGNDKNLVQAAVIGRRDGLYKALDSIDGKDSILSDYRDFKKAKEARMMLHALEGFQGWLKDRIKNEQEQTTDPEGDNE